MDDYLAIAYDHFEVFYDIICYKLLDYCTSDRRGKLFFEGHAAPLAARRGGEKTFSYGGQGSDRG
jgi:hypothetical protein